MMKDTWEKDLADKAIENGSTVPVSWRTEFDDGSDCCMPSGWYLFGLDKWGMEIVWPVRHEYGPFATEQEALNHATKI